MISDNLILERGVSAGDAWIAVYPTSALSFLVHANGGAEKNAFGLVPSTNDEGGDWGVWVPMPKRGREYYITVTIYQAKGPPYNLPTVF